MNEIVELNIVARYPLTSGRVPCARSSRPTAVIDRVAGFAMLELLVAAGLLATAVSLVATCAVAAQRVQRLQQQHTLAVDELSNQLERLTALPPSDIDSVLQQLQPSEWALQRLPGASVSGKRVDDEWGGRVELQLQWSRIGSPPPLVAVAWLRSESTTKDES